MYAQFPSNFSQNNPSTLSFSPQYPEPNEEVTVTLNDYSIDTSGAIITWFIDGKEVTEAKNERQIIYIAGALGDSNTITALTVLPNGTTLRAEKEIRPVRIDMLIEANTQVPVFYKGRSIPAVGGEVQVTALLFTGAPGDPQAYSYRWKMDGKILGGGSRFGKNSISFTADFEREVLVAVDILDTDGSVVASENTYIPLVQPELYFYEVNPLRGISEIAMTNNFILVGDEIKVRAEPYFIDTSLFANNPLQEWKLNQKKIINPSPDQQELTLRRSGDRGSFSLEYHIRNLKQLLQGIKGAITIRL